ncbi:MAG: hypothetical protein GY780_03935, partial [bacterium]|nr:hypothetical protein [bacterium]
MPDDIVRQRPELSLAKVWVLYFRFELWAVPPLLEAIETPNGKAVKKLPRGEIDLFNGILLDWKGQGERAMELIGRALEQIPAESIGIRNEAEIYYAVSSQTAG